MAIANVPYATYRLQFHQGFGFADAAALIPYLAELGVTHVYASPYLRAKPGSLHGYDIIDHNAINPEVGDNESFAGYCAALSEHGVGQILDFVPNHVGIFGTANRWFLDVLAWGEDSAFSEYFDIDWHPAKPELHGKLLVPLLGDHYGAVLTNGELKLSIDATEDGFSVWYYEHRLPVSPTTYTQILRPAIDRLVQTDENAGAPEARLGLLAAGFNELKRPARTRPARLARVALAERLRVDLGEELRNNAAFRQQVETVVMEMNGIAGEPLSFKRLHKLLEGQNYRLAYWRVAAEEINYRRFFQINELAGIRVELPEVFEAIHALVFRWIDQGLLHGLRIDHVDGLFDPQQYLQRLQHRYREGRNRGDAADPADPDGAPGDLYVVVEKILSSHESLPNGWPVAGTTGYEFLNRVNGLFVDPDGEPELTATYEAFVGDMPSFREMAYRGRKLAMEQELASELRVLANEINHLTEGSWYIRDYTLVGVRQALREIVASFPVYRTYVDWHGIRPEDRRDIDWAVAHGRRRSDRSDLSVFDFLHELLTTELGRGRIPAVNRREVRRLAMKFQQYTGAVMAKGLEDTAFYRYNRLLSLNEVGGEPTRFGVSVAAFHRDSQETTRRWPHTMLSTATHDTKRGEDVRARINVLSELPGEWAECLQRWSLQNRRHKSELNGEPAPSANDEYLFYQTLIGAWPVELMGPTDPDPEQLDYLRERMSEYMLKAVREAKAHSSWTNQDAAYEQALGTFVERALDGRVRNPFLESIWPVARSFAIAGVVNSLAQTTLKLTTPGVPDIYQGCELWDLSLVDPDNRRPVDFGGRETVLRMLRERWDEGSSNVQLVADLLNDWPSGAVKLFVTWRLLQLRRATPDVFLHGSYQPVDAEGPCAGNLCAFLRLHGDAAALVVVPRLVTRLRSRDAIWPIVAAEWSETTLLLPAMAAATMRNAFTGEPLTLEDADGGGTRLSLGKALENFPVGVCT
jgi:malto-oligosyltrehalose synthase